MYSLEIMADWTSLHAASFNLGLSAKTKIMIHVIMNTDLFFLVSSPEPKAQR